jgi:hypothetical protein
MKGHTRLRRTRRSALAVLALALPLGLGLGACGGGGSDGDVASAGEDESAPAANNSSGNQELTEEDALKFAECMRDNGIPDFPDPTVDEDGNVQIFGRRGGSGQPPVDPQSQQFQDAVDACRELLPTQTLTPEDQSAAQDQLLAMTQCMRDHGIDVPDPDFSEEGGGPRSVFEGVDTNDPNVRAALEECQAQIGGLNPGRGGDE